MKNTAPLEMATLQAPAVTKAGRFDRFAIILSLLSVYVIWGSTYLAMRIAISSVPPFLMAGIRFLIAGTILYVILRLRGTPAPTKAQWIGAAITGALLLAAGNGFIAFSEQWVASGLTAVGVAAVPIWTALFVGLMGRWPTRVEWCGLILGFSGVILLNLANNIWANPIGAIALLIGPICWAMGTALSTRVTLPNGLMSSAAEMLVGGIILIPLSLLFGERVSALPAPASLWALAFLVIFGSLIAFCAFGFLVRKVRPALATSYAYVNPVIAVVLGMALDGEHITFLGIAAMFVILSGVGLVSLGRKG